MLQLYMISRKRDEYSEVLFDEIFQEVKITVRRK